MKDFLTFAKERYSARKFKDTPVEQEKIDLMLQAAQVAPTACNNQPQKIYVLLSEEKRNALAEVCPCTFKAPVIFVVAYEESLAAEGDVEEGYNFGNTDCAIVTSHLLFEAEELGLGSCWVGWFNSEKVKAALGLPASVHVCDLLPVGYVADDFKPAKMHSSRKDLSETVEVM